MIFLSYCRDDETLARALYRGLREAGLDVWQDVFDLRPSDVWPERLADAIRQASGFLCLIGARGVEGWVKYEAIQAVIRQVEEGRLPILPLLVGSTPASHLPRFLKPFNALTVPADPQTLDCEVIARTFRARCERSMSTVDALEAALLADPRLQASGERHDLDTPAGRDEIGRIRQRMLQVLTDYEAAIGWNEARHIDLYGDVEGLTGIGKRLGVFRPVEERLRSALVSRGTEGIVLIGPPGGGKSVTLRHVCRMLLEDRGADRLAVYANLRDWPAGTAVTERNVGSFLFHQATAHLGDRQQQALSRNWEELLRRRRILFLVDSFDELPTVFAASDASQGTQRATLAAVSDAFRRFFQDCGAPYVVASRPFRRPEGLGRIEVHLRPISERDFRARWFAGLPVDPVSLLRRIREQRPEFLPILRNPFGAEMLARYLSKTQGELPPSVLALYEDHLTEAVRAVLRADRRSDSDEAAADCLSLASLAATAIYGRDLGALSIPVETLRARLCSEDFDSTLETLCRARVLRVDSERRVMFVHRRLAEFFYVRNLVEFEREPDMEQILGDSRFRDGLVVYASVAPEDKASELARLCHRAIAAGREKLLAEDVPAAIVAIHALRFLRDAFPGRPDALAGFRDELRALILALCHSRNLLLAKIGAECIGLLPEEDREPAIRTALKQQSLWVVDTAFRSLLYARRASPATVMLLNRQMYMLPAGHYFSRLRELSFLLSTVSCGRRLKVGLYGRAVSYGVTAGALGVVAVRSLPAALGLILFWLLARAYAAGCVRNQWFLQGAHHSDAALDALSTTWKMPTLRQTIWSRMKAVWGRRAGRGTAEVIAFQSTTQDMNLRLWWPRGYPLFFAGQNRQALQLYYLDSAGFSFFLLLFALVLSRQEDPLFPPVIVLLLNPGLAVLPEALWVGAAIYAGWARHTATAAIRLVLSVMFLLIGGYLAVVLGTRWLVGSGAASGVAIGLVLLTYLAGFGVISLILLRAVARRLTCRFRDLPVIRRTVRRPDLRRADIYATLAALRTPHGRRLFLDELYREKTSIVDPEAPPPAGNPDWLTAEIADGLARLEEQWQALGE